MSKEHKMVYKGKKYKTIKTINGSYCPPCKGCVFFAADDHQCPIVSNSTTRQCVHHNNEDGINRIWVEDTIKPNRENHYWIVEEHSTILGWSLYDIFETRSKARECVKYTDKEDKTRIRKYIPAK
jgi:hypothetical protein